MLTNGSVIDQMEILRRKEVKLLIAVAENKKFAADVEKFIWKEKFPEKTSLADRLKFLMRTELRLLNAVAENKNSVADVQKFLRENYPAEYPKPKKV